MAGIWQEIRVFLKENLISSLTHVSLYDRRDVLFNRYSNSKSLPSPPVSKFQYQMSIYFLSPTPSRLWQWCCDRMIVLCAVFSPHRLALHMQRKSLTHICGDVTCTFLLCVSKKRFVELPEVSPSQQCANIVNIKKRTNYEVSEKSVYDFKPHQSYWVIYTSSGAVKRTIKYIIAEVI